MILDSPVLPVMKGENVTLRCQTKSLKPVFLKNVSNIMTTSPMTIYNFSKSDEMTYKCRTENGEESPSSWLLMKGKDPPEF